MAVYGFLLRYAIILLVMAAMEKLFGQGPIDFADSLLAAIMASFLTLDAKIDRLRTPASTVNTPPRIEESAGEGEGA